MPANLVGPGEEKYWNRAKVSCKAAASKEGFKVGGERYWECVGGAFKRIKANAAKGKTKRSKR